VNRFRWKTLRVPLEFRSPNVGAICDELSQLVDLYRVESKWWITQNADDLWFDAWTLAAVRDDLMNGILSADDAKQWVEAGHVVLKRYQDQRRNVA